jgi:pimeloyl-ACP methyl ester carboxylesterase
MSCYVQPGRHPCRNPSKRHRWRFRITANAPSSASVLSAGARRWSRHGSSLHDHCGRRACQATHRNVALSVSIHGATTQATRSTADSAGGCPRCSRCSTQICTETSTHSRRQVIRRSDDVAGSSGGTPGERERVGFLGFPLHAAGRPSHDRAEHLFEVKIPMLFLQGTRDTLASLDELRPVCKRLGKLATLELLADADHSFHVPAGTGRRDTQVVSEALDAFSEWLDRVPGMTPNQDRSDARFVGSKMK